MIWTEEKINTLIDLWNNTQLSCTQIANKLGCTKNAIIGKAHRLKLAKRVTSQTSKIEKIVQEKFSVKKEILAKKKTIEKPKQTVKEENKHYHLQDLTLDMCHWPVGDPKDDDFHFCGKKVIDGKPYCPLHCAFAYV